jgi:hypothetical protein
VDHGPELAEQGIAHVTRRTIRAVPELGPLLWLHLVPPAVVFPADYVRRLCSRADPRASTMVISEESALGDMPSNESPAPYPCVSGAAAAFRWLSRFFELRVCWIVRRQDTWLESMYAFRVSRGLGLDFQQFCQLLAPRLHLLPVARALAEGASYELCIGSF